jgi:flavin reductase (DIM6/NTAB) family NADH-FMN oxidoreductase RutF
MIDSKAFRNILGSFATGVTVVTTKDSAGKPVGMTANSFSSLSLDPPLVLWSIAKSASLYTEFTAAESFAIQILAKGQQHLSNQFSRKGIERFDGISYETNNRGVPLLNDCLARFDCELFSQADGGDHTIIVGYVAAMEELQLDPLIFHKGAYRTLEP